MSYGGAVGTDGAVELGIGDGFHYSGLYRWTRDCRGS